jgi:hypothetical protein
MRKMARRPMRICLVSVSAVALSLLIGLAAPSVARADEALSGARVGEASAKNLLKAMSDYMASQEAISFDFDAILEVVTTEDQKLALASSGAVILNRPGKIRATRAGGHADIEMLFDGNTLTLFGNNANLYTQIDAPGTVDDLVDVLRKKYDRPLPAADLLMSSVYEELMADVTDVKDLGSGVINGVECDYLAFRSKVVDWQIWIAQGDTPSPCRYVITSKDIPHSPEYSVQIRNWKTGSAATSNDFVFKNSTKAKKVDVADLKGMSPFPDHFKGGAAE